MDSIMRYLKKVLDLKQKKTIFEMVLLTMIITTPIMYLIYGVYFLLGDYVVLMNIINFSIILISITYFAFKVIQVRQLKWNYYFLIPFAFVLFLFGNIVAGFLPFTLLLAIKEPVEKV